MICACVCRATTVVRWDCMRTVIVNNRLAALASAPSLLFVSRTRPPTQYLQINDTDLEATSRNDNGQHVPQTPMQRLSEQGQLQQRSPTAAAANSAQLLEADLDLAISPDGSQHDVNGMMDEADSDRGIHGALLGDDAQADVVPSGGSFRMQHSLSVAQRLSSTDFAAHPAEPPAGDATSTSQHHQQHTPFPAPLLSHQDLVDAYDHVVVWPREHTQGSSVGVPPSMVPPIPVMSDQTPSVVAVSAVSGQSPPPPPAAAPAAATTVAAAASDSFTARAVAVLAGDESVSSITVEAPAAPASEDRTLSTPHDGGHGGQQAPPPASARPPAAATPRGGSKAGGSRSAAGAAASSSSSMPSTASTPRSASSSRSTSRSAGTASAGAAMLDVMASLRAEIDAAQAAVSTASTPAAGQTVPSASADAAVTGADSSDNHVLASPPPRQASAASVVVSGSMLPPATPVTSSTSATATTPAAAAAAPAAAGVSPRAVQAASTPLPSSPAPILNAAASNGDASAGIHEDEGSSTRSGSDAAARSILADFTQVASEQPATAATRPGTGAPQREGSSAASPPPSRSGSASARTSAPSSTPAPAPTGASNIGDRLTGFLNRLSSSSSAAASTGAVSPSASSSSKSAGRGIAGGSSSPSRLLSSLLSTPKASASSGAAGGRPPVPTPRQQQQQPSLASPPPPQQPYEDF